MNQTELKEMIVAANERFDSAEKMYNGTIDTLVELLPPTHILRKYYNADRVRLDPRGGIEFRYRDDDGSFAYEVISADWLLATPQERSAIDLKERQKRIGEYAAEMERQQRAEYEKLKVEYEKLKAKFG